ncbi:complement factor H-like [Hypanus sabinus]|uniref:complement factor H-like n=1 Tax=Hypanus sabinus TaxID=79690 RepID=UPI0028C3A2FE|nr:complement factor H-like [Hypanus sabinus]
MFKHFSEDLNEYTVVVVDFTKAVVDKYIPMKSFTVFPSQTLWMNHKIHNLLKARSVRSASECSQPERIKNATPRLSTRNNRYPHNSFVTYQCDSGYVGILRYMCVDGQWIKDNPDLTCSLKRCGTPEDILHGSFKLIQGEDLVFGARIEYTCDEGYQLVGTRNYSDCELSGWSGRAPYCEVKTCPPVNNPENGRIAEPGFFDNDHDYPFGSFLRFECNSPDLEIHGASQIYCLENGTWSNPVPKCKELKCKRPDIPNANVKTKHEEFRHLEQLSYTCNRNYKPSGLRSTTCTQTGWNPPPLCTLSLNLCVFLRLNPGVNPNTQAPEIC